MAINLINISCYNVTNFPPDFSFLTDIITTLGVIIAIAIPLSLGIIISNADKYDDKELASYFIREPLCVRLFFSLIMNLLAAFTLKFMMSYEEKYIISIYSNHYILLCVYIWFGINIATFILFIKLLMRYVIDTENVFLEKLRNDIKDIFEE